MAFIEPNPVQATEKAGGKGTVTIVHLLTEKELQGHHPALLLARRPRAPRQHGDLPHPLRYGALQRQRPRGHAPCRRDDVLRRRRKARHRERVEDGRSHLHGANHQQVRTAAVRLPVQPHVPAPAFAGCGHLICLPLLPSASFLAKIESYGCQRGQSQMRDCPRSISRNGV